MSCRHLAWALLLSSLAVLFCGLEVGYRYLAHARLLQTKLLIEEVHSDALLSDEYYVRFGEQVESLEVSLFQDSMQWALSHWGQPVSLSSRLVSIDPQGLHHPFQHSYALVNLRLKQGDSHVNHTFIWSPRRLKFVRFHFWNDCTATGCPCNIVEKRKNTN